MNRASIGLGRQRNSHSMRAPVHAAKAIAGSAIGAMADVGHQPPSRVFRVEHLAIARTFRQRLRGLLGTAVLPDTAALLIQPCRGIHTLGMRYAIDLLFLDADRRILRIDHGVRPWQLRACGRASAVLEMNAGCATAMGLQPGDQLFLGGRS